VAQFAAGENYFACQAISMPRWLAVKIF
jgi:hypothetical protein